MVPLRLSLDQLLLGIVGLPLVLVDVLDHAEDDDQDEDDDDTEDGDEEDQVGDGEELGDGAVVGHGVHGLHGDDRVGHLQIDVAILLPLRLFQTIDLQHSDSNLRLHHFRAVNFIITLLKIV